MRQTMNKAMLTDEETKQPEIKRNEARIRYLQIKGKSEGLTRSEFEEYRQYTIAGNYRFDPEIGRIFI